jgi:hypothetical protein
MTEGRVPETPGAQVPDADIAGLGIPVIWSEDCLLH